MCFHDAGKEILEKAELSRARELRPGAGWPPQRDAPRWVAMIGLDIDDERGRLIFSEGGDIMIEHWPSVADLENAHRVYEEKEPRDLFYKIATELTTLAIEKKTSISLSEALASLLQTWNKAYYQYRIFDTKHFDDIDKLIERTRSILLKIRKNEIVCSPEEIKSLFTDYEVVLGPVGASKCLHLLVPDFFPLWDRAIAKKYGLPLKTKGHNAEMYVQFLHHAQEQCKRIGQMDISGKKILKAIDQFNYCKFTKGWL